MRKLEEDRGQPFHEHRLVLFVGHTPLSHATERFTLEPVEIGGVTIPAREWVLCVTSSANRDPDRFPDAGRLDVGRDAGGHLAFGHGIHFCLGAPLARLEAKHVFTEVLRQLRAIERVSPVQHVRSNFVRALRRLDIAYAAA